MANFNAIVCAGSGHLGAESGRGVLYTSDQAHHRCCESAKLAGVRKDRVRRSRRRSLQDRGIISRGD